MKKELFVLLCAAAALFLGSCSDMEVSQGERYDLPSDFSWREYAEINKDVAMSQIILNVSGGEASRTYLQATASNCANLLSDSTFAAKIYLEYAFCPNPGWSKKGACPGAYANRDNYNIVTGSDTTCSIGGCWSGGWDKLSDKDALLCTGDDNYDWNKPECNNIPRTLASILQDSLKKYPASASSPSGFSRTLPAIRMMCLFMPQMEKQKDVEEYLKSYYYLNGDALVYGSKIDSGLISQHYHITGIYDGKPYKYCEQGHMGQEKSQELAEKRSSYYDYGKYTFCLNKSDEKIYVVK
ncbi:MAG: hypothetical protein FWC26_00240 [Fibromonadales bacterium]|nr:hypothetical protein [Fibromonadales bacterium]